MSEEEDEFVESAVQFALAKSQMEFSASYLARGRNLTDLSDDALKTHWAAVFKAWVRGQGPQQAYDDAAAELSFRNIELPVSLAQEEFDDLLRRAREVALDPAAKDTVGESIHAQSVPAEKLQKATGLAQIMARAGTCRFSIDAEKARAYYVAQGLAMPEVLDYISMKVAQESGWVAQTTETECAITEATAQAIGILK